MIEALHYDANGEQLFVDDRVEPIRFSHGTRRIVGLRHGYAVLECGLRIKTADLIYRPAN